MNARHATTVVKRNVAASPERVFRAWANERGAWDAPNDDWVIAEHRDDPRPDGEQSIRFGPSDDPQFEMRGRYLVVRENRLLIMAGVMHARGEPMTATMTTIDISPHGEGTHLAVTDQSAYFGDEDETMRQAGWSKMIDRLEKHVMTNP